MTSPESTASTPIEHKTESLELIFNPAEAAKREASIAAAKMQAKATFAKIDLEKSYPALFELLWYSQMPCFDVKSVTSTVKDEYGVASIKLCSFKLFSKIVFHIRNPEVVCLEGPQDKLLQHLHHVPHRQGDVLLVQHAEGRGDIQGEQVQGVRRQVHQAGQGQEL